MKRILLGGLLLTLSQPLLADEESARTIAAVLGDLNLSASAISDQVNSEDITLVAQALVNELGISAEEIIAQFAENGRGVDLIEAVEALVTAVPEQAAAIVQRAIESNGELAAEVVTAAVEANGSVVAAVVDGALSSGQIEPDDVIVAVADSGSTEAITDAVREVVSQADSTEEIREIIDVAVDASIEIAGAEETVVNDIVAAAVYGAADAAGSSIEGDRVIIDEDGTDEFVEEVAGIAAEVVSGDLDVAPADEQQIAVEGVAEIISILDFEDPNTETIAEIVDQVTEARPEISTAVLTAVTASQPPEIVTQSVSVISENVGNSDLPAEDQGELLAQISDVSGVDVTSGAETQSPTDAGTQETTDTPDDTADAAGSEEDGGGDTADPTGDAGSGVASPGSESSSPSFPSNNSGSPPPGGGGGGGGDTINDDQPASNS